MSKPKFRFARLRSESGLTDLASVLIGVIALGIVTSVVLVTITTIIPWVQDTQAQAELNSIKMAESTAFSDVTPHVYLPLAALISGGYLTDPNAIATISTGAPTTTPKAGSALGTGSACFVISMRSNTGNVFYATNKDVSTNLYVVGTSSTSWCATLANAVP